MSGACPGRMPRYPFLPGICISSATSFTTIFSGVTISIWKVSAIKKSLVFGHWSLANDHRPTTNDGTLRCCLHLLGGWGSFFEGSLHVEGLLRDVVIFAFDDSLEGFHRVGNLHVTTRRSGELLGDVERLRQEALHFAGA